ncbi:hypothetical protein Q8A73_002498 [Channa argus]|nr:hypothetical protein Q8A73_002498 [Channa argus]
MVHRHMTDSRFVEELVAAQLITHVEQPGDSTLLLLLTTTLGPSAWCAPFCTSRAGTASCLCPADSQCASWALPGVALQRQDAGHRATSWVTSLQRAAPGGAECPSNPTPHHTTPNSTTSPIPPSPTTSPSDQPPTPSYCPGIYRDRRGQVEGRGALCSLHGRDSAGVTLRGGRTTSDADDAGREG